MADLAHASLEFRSEDEDDVLDQLAVEVGRSVDRGDAVMVCLPDERSERLRWRLPIAVATGVRWSPASQRYARPVDAMAGLWAFTTSALRNGSTRVHSIGELTYRGDPEADAPWHWYEAAVNQVFAGTPLHATCLVDTTRTPDHVLDEVRRVHPACSHAGALRPSEHFDEGSWAAPQLAEVAVPDTPPALRARVTDRTELRELRERIEAAAGLLGPALVCRLLLVTTELATNALLHGGGEPEVAVWVEPSAAVVRVSDGGPGLTDPFASLRPPELPLRGAGLWVAHVESDQLHLASSPGSTTVTARFDR